jgi:hypothetical protein
MCVGTFQVAESAGTVRVPDIGLKIVSSLPSWPTAGSAQSVPLAVDQNPGGISLRRLRKRQTIEVAATPSFLLFIAIGQGPVRAGSVSYHSNIDTATSQRRAATCPTRSAGIALRSSCVGDQR